MVERGGGVSGLLVALLLAACGQPPAAPLQALEPEPVAAFAAEPPRRPATLVERLRQEAWLTRFWEQLTPAQKRRVTARLRQVEPPLVSDAAAAPVWDAMGLPERDALVFGPSGR
jgi:hypothetical protein